MLITHLRDEAPGALAVDGGSSVDLGDLVELYKRAKVGRRL